MSQLRIRKRGKTFLYIFEVGKKVIEKGGSAKKNQLMTRELPPTKELTPAKLDSWIRNLQKDGYSKNTISQLHSFIHHAWDYAVYPVEFISSNSANLYQSSEKSSYEHNHRRKTF